MEYPPVPDLGQLNYDVWFEILSHTHYSLIELIKLRRVNHLWHEYIINKKEFLLPVTTLHYKDILLLHHTKCGSIHGSNSSYENEKYHFLD